MSKEGSWTAWKFRKMQKDPRKKVRASDKCVCFFFLGLIRSLAKLGVVLLSGQIY